MKTKAKFFALFAFSLLSSLSAHAGWKLENAFFYIESYKAVCTDCNTYSPADGFTMPSPNLDIDVSNRYLMTGRIEINQIDPDTYATSKTVIEGVKLQMSAKGVIIDATRGGNSRMRITNLGGKKINDIFSSPFNGGKVRLNFIIDLAMMIARNKQGVMIVDNEDILAFALSLDIVVTKLKFSMDNTVNQVTVYDSQGAVTTKANVSGAELLSTQLH